MLNAVDLEERFKKTLPMLTRQIEGLKLLQKTRKPRPDDEKRVGLSAFSIQHALHPVTCCFFASRHQMCKCFYSAGSCYPQRRGAPRPPVLSRGGRWGWGCRWHGCFGEEGEWSSNAWACSACMPQRTEAVCRAPTVCQIVYYMTCTSNKQYNKNLKSYSGQISWRPINFLVVGRTLVY